MAKSWAMIFFLALSALSTVRSGIGAIRATRCDMIVAGLFRLAASSRVFLLATTTSVFMMFMQQAGARSTESEDGAAGTDPCPAEVLACNGEDTCSGCMNVTRSMEFEACISVEARGAFNSTSMLSNCAVGKMAVCCVNGLTEHDCMGNDVYLKYLACGLQKFGCSADEDLSCSEDNEDTWLRAIHGGEGVGSITDSPIGATVTIFALAFVLLAAGVSARVVIFMKHRPGSESPSKIT